jgi:hypothetical protein
VCPSVQPRLATAHGLDSMSLVPAACPVLATPASSAATALGFALPHPVHLFLD